MNVGEEVEPLEFSCIADGDVKCTVTLNNSLAVYDKVKCVFTTLTI
jgi:hypothetical protein